MQLQGTHTVAASVEQTFEKLNDPAILQRCILGCEKMEKTGEDQYAARLQVGLAAMKGNFAGKVRVTEKHPPHDYTLQIEGSGPLGFLKGTAKIALRESNGKTAVSYTAEAHVGGVIAAVGSRVVEVAAKGFAAEFFARFGKAVGGAA